MLPPKYEPTSDIPKFPFFMDEENASGVLRTEVIIISRKIQGTGFVVLPLKNFHWGLIHLWNRPDAFNAGMYANLVKQTYLWAHPLNKH